MGTPSTGPGRRPSLVGYAAAVLTAAMVLYPPFTSLTGTEYAFLLTGPEWSREMGAVAEELGLRPHIHWIALLVQLGAVWAIALGVRRLLTRAPERSNPRPWRP